MVQVEILVGVVDVKGEFVDDVPELVLEDEEIILAPMSKTRHTGDGDDHPHP